MLDQFSTECAIIHVVCQFFLIIWRTYIEAALPVYYFTETEFLSSIGVKVTLSAVYKDRFDMDILLLLLLLLLCSFIIFYK